MASIYSIERIVRYYKNAKKAYPRYTQEALVRLTADAHGMGVEEIKHILEDEDKRQETVRKMAALQ